MNATEFEQVATEILLQCKSTLLSKGADYTRGCEDKLINFKSTGESLGVTPLQVAGIFLRKQLDPIYKYIKGGTLESEPIQSRIADSINYLILFYALIKEAERAILDGAIRVEVAQ